MSENTDNELNNVFDVIKSWGLSGEEVKNNNILAILEKIVKDPKQPISNELYSPKYIWGVSVADLKNFDLSKLPKDLLYRISFSTMTKWPSKDKLPKDFDPKKLIDNAKTFKGLGVERLHTQGITGKGVTIAYIDKPFDTRHVEFNSEKIKYIPMGNGIFDFHGYAVAARLAGQNIGVAKDIDLIYYACGGKSERYEYLDGLVYDELRSLKDIIKRWENNERIDAIGMSGSIPYQISLIKDEKLKKQFETTYDKLKKKLDELGIPLIDSETFWDKGFSYCFKIDPKLPNDDKDNFFDKFSAMSNSEKMSVIDADKCIPLAYTLDGYKYENFIGSASWSIPQVVGLYALAKQIDKEVTFDEFVDITRKTLDPANTNGTRLINSQNLMKEICIKKEMEAE